MVIPQSRTDANELVFERIMVGSALIQQIAIALHPADGVLHVDPPFTHRPIEQFVPGRQLPSRLPLLFARPLLADDQFGEFVVVAQPGKTQVHHPRVAGEPTIPRIEFRQ